MKKDIGMLGKGKSDPYAIITVGAQTFKTKIIDNTVNPKWDFWCEVPIEMIIFLNFIIQKRFAVRSPARVVLRFILGNISASHIT